jgi:hypothetical protein
MAAGRNLPSKNCQETTRRRTGESARLRCRARGHHAPGAFASFADRSVRPTAKRENRRNQSHSSRRPERSGPSAHDAAYGRVRAELQGLMVQCSNNHLQGERLRSNFIWPFPGPVLDEQNFYLMVTHSICHDVGSARDHEFTSASYLTGSSDKRIGGKQPCRP